MSEEAYRRNVVTIRRLANEIIQQCDFYDRNRKQGDDTIRVLVIHAKVSNLWAVTERAYNRWRREHPR